MRFGCFGFFDKNGEQIKVSTTAGNCASSFCFDSTFVYSEHVHVLVFFVVSLVIDLCKFIYFPWWFNTKG